MCVCGGDMCVYIYRQRKRERERERKDINVCVCLMCVFIHTNSQVHVYYIVHTHKGVKNRPDMLDEATKQRYGVMRVGTPGTFDKIQST